MKTGAVPDRVQLLRASCIAAAEGLQCAALVADGRPDARGFVLLTFTSLQKAGRIEKIGESPYERDLQAMSFAPRNI